MDYEPHTILIDADDQESCKEFQKEIQKSCYELNKNIEDLEKLFNIQFTKIVERTLLGSNDIEGTDGNVSELNATVAKRMCLFLKAFPSYVKRKAEKHKGE